MCQVSHRDQRVLYDPDKDSQQQAINNNTNNNKVKGVKCTVELQWVKNLKSVMPLGLERKFFLLVECGFVDINIFYNARVRLGEQ